MRLKKFRAALCLLFFLSVFFSFLPGAEFPSWLTAAPRLQLIPSILRALSSPAALPLYLLLILAIFFGRIYCSVICPLGALQDLLIYASHRTAKRLFRHHPAWNSLRFALLAALLLSTASGTLLLLNLLDPYAVFGRLAQQLFVRFFSLLYNRLAALAERLGFCCSWPFTELHSFGPPFYLSLAVLLMVVLCAWTRGRLICNTLCPAGTLLGLLSPFSLYKVRLSKKHCTSCRRCESVCKAECLDSRKQSIDYSRCIACFNCLAVCSQGALQFSLINPSPCAHTDPERRSFLLHAAAWCAAAGAAGMGLRPALAFTKREPVPCPVTPPGSRGVEHFSAYCIGCGLCAAACPSRVITPSLLVYAAGGIMQPHLSYRNGHCEYNCTSCSQVCPTGAILPLSLREKQSIQIGQAHYLEERCVVKTKGKECGACAEVCPSLALKMVKRGNLFFPELEPRLCVGCGHCQVVCPAWPKAMYVTGLYRHQAAQMASSKPLLPLQDNPKEEFPF